jgi:hypothetical protein
MSDQPRSVGETLDRLEEAADRHDPVSMGDAVGAFGNRSYGPFLMVPALLEISPVGMIPGVPTLLSLVIILFAGQMLAGRSRFWLPRFIAERSVSSDKLRKAVEKMRPVGRWMDRIFHGRLTLLTEGPFVRVAAAVCILLALTVPPLELVPFASSAPMAAIALVGLALLVRDGAVMIVAAALMLVAMIAGVGWLGGSG